MGIYQQNPLLVWFLADTMKILPYENHIFISDCMPGNVRSNFYPHYHSYRKVLSILNSPNATILIKKISSVVQQFHYQ